MNGVAPAVSVVICTYNRPRMLATAVHSCLRDATQTGLPFEIVIADNSPDGHAIALVAELAGGAVPVRRAAASPANISVARNAGLRAARAPLVAFMDDDLQVDPGWLDAFVATLTISGADAAVGPVRADFPAGPPAWDPQGSRFVRVLAHRSGDTIAVTGPDKPVDFAISTASSIWRAATCFTDAEPFDLAFGACGGEDFDLFLRLERRGRRIVWCAEAGVRETIPRERTELSHHIMRAYSGAQAYAAARIKNSDRKALTTLDVMARGAVQTVACCAKLGVLAAMQAVGGEDAKLRVRLEVLAVSSAFGKVMWWRKLSFYQIEKPPVSA
jgi:succinoglycan biosynthesis protein ExoM